MKDRRLILPVEWSKILNVLLRIEWIPSRQQYIGRKAPLIVDAKARRKTFENSDWSSSLKTSVDDLVRDGFYYVGPYDCVACCYCGLILCDWLTHERPLPKHQRVGKFCILLDLRFRHLVRDMLEECNVELQLTDMDQNKVEKDVTIGSDVSKCVVCLENDRVTVTLPCKHLAACRECSNRLTKCPVCRTPVFAYIHIYNP